MRFSLIKLHSLKIQAKEAEYCRNWWWCVLQRKSFCLAGLDIPPLKFPICVQPSVYDTGLVELSYN